MRGLHILRSPLIVWYGEVVVLGIGRDGAYPTWIERCRLLVQHLHVTYIIDECDFFQQHHQSFSVHLHSQDHAVEGQFAYGRVFLRPLLSHDKMYPSRLPLSTQRTLVLTMRSSRGVRIMATREVEKSCSTREMSSSYEWLVSSKGSVLYTRSPRVVAT